MAPRMAQTPSPVDWPSKKVASYIHADNKLGRGRALMNAWSKVDGEIYAYIDRDLATDM